MQKCTNVSRVCVYHCVQLSYTTKHRAVIFPLILQTSTRAQILSIGKEGEFLYISTQRQLVDMVRTEILVL